MGGRRLWAIRWDRNSLMLAWGEDNGLKRAKAAGASDTLGLKWWVEVIVGESQ